jgi:hypothetical protein
MWNSIPTFNLRMSSWFAADHCRDPATVGDRLSAGFRAPGDRALPMVPSNLARHSVFDLSVAHLHRLIALHIITKFPA